MDGGGHCRCSRCRCRLRRCRCCRFWICEWFLDGQMLAWRHPISHQSGIMSVSCQAIILYVCTHDNIIIHTRYITYYAVWDYTIPLNVQFKKLHPPANYCSEVRSTMVLFLYNVLLCTLSYFILCDWILFDNTIPLFIFSAKNIQTVWILHTN